ncbi:MAG: class I SAM-dependent methyltransferase [Desulfobacterales bacterium]|nr:class I SAM-dependent methyltransferase [Desulfobacterales bacterium]
MISKSSAHWSIFEKVRVVLDRYKDCASGTLLDIGCGTKPFQEVFEGKVRHYLGVDIPSKIKRGNLRERAETIDIYGDCLNLPVRASSVDTVFCSFVIEHIFEYDQLMDEAWRVLKKGAHLYLVSPLLVAIHETPYDFFRFTEHSLKRIAEKHEFETLHIVPAGGEFLFWGNRIAAHIHKIHRVPVTRRVVEGISYLVQRLSLCLDNKTGENSFICNYLCVFRKK